MASNSTKITIAAVAAIAVATVAAVMLAGFSPSSISQNGAMAQSDNKGSVSQPTDTQGVRRSLTYYSTQTVLVRAASNATAQALCMDRDVLLTGGYTIGGFSSPDSISGGKTILYSNTAVRIINATTIHEGWQAGLVNAGTGNLTITANAVCLNVAPDRTS